MRVREALRASAERLSRISGTPALDAELLMAAALGAERGEMLLHRVEEPVPEAFARLLERRLAGEPVAYITGRRAFWTIELEVGPGVLIPRPDSETLIEAAVEHFGADGPRTILDLGTGSGALLLAALDQWPEARGIGVDSSLAAIRIARHNLRKLGMGRRARIVHGDWLGRGGPHDLILCNPPYVPDGQPLAPEVVGYEPREALFGGLDGLDAYRMIAPVLAPQLAPGGLACVEIGLGQGAAAAALFEAQGFSVAVRKDLAGIDRCLVMTA